MKNILLINQPNNNRGDEAAHRSLLRTLNLRFPEIAITVIFTQTCKASVEQMKVDHPNNIYHVINTVKRGRMLVRYLSFKYGFVGLSTLHPAHFKVTSYIKKTDLVLCAPGGISMGLFQNWEHLYWLNVAKHYKKRIAYYSRSFGPFPIATKKNRLFKRVSENLLRYFDFISIRDAKTMRFADELKLSYVPSIDTAFLDEPVSELPDNLCNIFKSKDYAVFVPNKLLWHPAFKQCDAEFINSMYRKILDSLLNLEEIKRVVLLPQLFMVDERGDYKYFKEIFADYSKDQVLIIDDNLSSDVQQNIIANSAIIIGARYHSIVFAINNLTPFVALSYEHKISGLLELLNLNEYMVNIEALNSNADNPDEIAHKVVEKVNMRLDLSSQKFKAREIAIECMDAFANQMMTELK